MSSAVATAYPHVTKVEGKPAYLTEEPRIRVSMIARAYLDGSPSVDDLCRRYSHYLTPSLGHAAMLYYFDHKEEVDAEIRAEDELLRRIEAEAKPSAIMTKLRELKQAGGEGAEIEGGTMPAPPVPVRTPA